MNIIKTRTQKKREREHKKIICMYKELREDNPEVSRHAIFMSIANRIGWTRQGVEKVVKRYNESRKCQMDG